MDSRKTELDLAQKIQQALFPKTCPVCPLSKIAAKNRMANTIGGDFYDFIDLPDAKRVFLIGDVTGHGIFSAIVQSMLMGVLHLESLHKEPSPPEILESIDLLFCEFKNHIDIPLPQLSTTIFYSIIDYKQKKISFSNAGHPPPLLYSESKYNLLKSSAPPMGFIHKTDYALNEVPFESKDRLFMYTDGLYEAKNKTSNMFGMDTLLEQVKSITAEVPETLEDIFKAVEKFTEGGAQDDDMSAVIVEFN